MHPFLQLIVLALWCWLAPVAHAQAGSEATQPNVVSVPAQQPGDTASSKIVSSKQMTCGENILREPRDVVLDDAGTQDVFPCSGTFQLFEEGTKKPLKGQLYAITSGGKLIYTGHADETGRTVRFLSNKETTLNLHKDVAAYCIIEQHYSPPRTRFAETFDNIWPDLVVFFLLLLVLVLLCRLLRRLAARRKGNPTCSVKKPNNIRRWGARGLVMILAVYAVQRFVLPFEFDISPPGLVFFYYPQWACGEDCPPYVVIDTDNTALQPSLGKEARVFERTIDVYHTEEYSRFFQCYGQFKRSVGMYLWELSSEQINRKNVTGRYFDAAWCSYAEPTPQQSKMIDKFLGGMMGIEPEELETEN